MFPRRRRITSKIVRKTRTKICVQFIYHSTIVIYDSRAAIYTEVTRASQQYNGYETTWTWAVWPRC